MQSTYCSTIASLLGDTGTPDVTFKPCKTPSPVLMLSNGSSVHAPERMSSLVVCRSKEEILEEIKQLQSEMSKLDEKSQAETAASKEN